MKDNIFKILLLTISLCSLGLLIYSTQTTNITSDSLDYISAATSLSEGLPLRKSDGTLYTNWPPLFPLIIGLLGDPVGLKIRILHLLLYALTLITTYFLSIKLINSRRIYIFFWLAICFSTSLLMQFNFVWSEPLFIFLFTIKLLLLKLFLNTNRKVYFVLLTAAGVLLCLQRYAGLFIIPSMGLILYYYQPNKFRIALWYTLVSITPVMAWIIWTFMQKSGASPTMFGNNLFTEFFSNLWSSYYYSVFASWFVPSAVGFRWGGVLFGGFCLALILLLYKFRDQITREVTMLMISTLCYFVAINLIDYSPIVANITQYNQLSDFKRYLSVLYIPILLILFFTIDKIYAASIIYLRYLDISKPYHLECLSSL